MFLQGLYNKLYVQLSTDMHTTLNKLLAQPALRNEKPAPSKAGTAVSKSKGVGSSSRHQLAVLKGLADEAELTGDRAAADTYHQERILAPANAQVGLRCIRIHAIVLPSVVQALVCARMSYCCLWKLILHPSMSKGACLLMLHYKDSMCMVLMMGVWAL